MQATTDNRELVPENLANQKLSDNAEPSLELKQLDKADLGQGSSEISTQGNSKTKESGADSKLSENISQEPLATSLDKDLQDKFLDQNIVFSTMNKQDLSAPQKTLDKPSSTQEESKDLPEQSSKDSSGLLEKKFEGEKKKEGDSSESMDEKKGLSDEQLKDASDKKDEGEDVEKSRGLLSSVAHKLIDTVSDMGGKLKDVILGESADDQDKKDESEGAEKKDDASKQFEKAKEEIKDIAQEKKEQLQEKFSDKKEELSDKAEEKAGDAQEKLSDKKEEFESKKEDLKDSAAEKTDEAKEESKGLIANLTDRIVHRFEQAKDFVTHHKEDISETAGDLKDKAADATSSLQEKGSQMMSDAKDKMQDFGAFKEEDALAKEDKAESKEEDKQPDLQMEKNQEEDLEANKKGGIFGLGVADFVVDKAKDIGSVLQHAIHDAFVSENKDEGADASKEESKDKNADLKGTFETSEDQSKDLKSDKKNFKFEASDFEFGKTQEKPKTVPEETKVEVSVSQAKKTFGDENIRHNWPTVDSQPKVHHIKPRKFKTAADNNDDIQIDFSTIEQKELPKNSEILAMELKGGALDQDKESSSPTEKEGAQSLNPESLGQPDAKQQLNFTKPLQSTDMLSKDATLADEHVREEEVDTVVKDSKNQQQEDNIKSHNLVHTEYNEKPQH